MKMSHLIDCQIRLSEVFEVAKGDVTLLYPPVMIIFKPLKTSCPQFDSLQQGEIPLFSTEVGFHISMSACKRVQIHH